MDEAPVESEMVSDVVDEAIIEDEVEDDDKYTSTSDEKYSLFLTLLLSLTHSSTLPLLRLQLLFFT